MRQRLLIFVMLCGSVFGIVDMGRTEKPLGLHIKVVDERHNAFNVQTVRWWYVGNVAAIYQLKCQTDLCSEWVLEENVSGSIVIRAAMSIVTKNDLNCWDLYSGEVVVDMPATETTIIVGYVNTACK